MRLGKFEFYIRFERGLLDTEADVYSRLRSFRETAVPVDADISKYLFLFEVTTTSCEGKDDLDASLALPAITTPSFGLITSGEVRMSHNGDGFNHTKSACFGEGKRVLFVLSSDSILLLSVD